MFEVSFDDSVNKIYACPSFEHSVTIVTIDQLSRHLPDVEWNCVSLLQRGKGAYRAWCEHVDIISCYICVHFAVYFVNILRLYRVRSHYGGSGGIRTHAPEAFIISHYYFCRSGLYNCTCVLLRFGRFCSKYKHVTFYVFAAVAQAFSRTLNTGLSMFPCHCSPASFSFVYISCRCSCSETSAICLPK